MSIIFAAQQAHRLSAEFVKEVRSTTASLLEFFARHRSTLTNSSNHENKKTLEEDVTNKAVSLVMMLKDKELWYEEAQWLLHPRILAHIDQLMRQLASIDWQQVFSIPEPTSPTFFMEGYTGPSPPIPPTHLLQAPKLPVITQSAPPILPPQDRSVQRKLSVEPTVPLPRAQVSVEPQAPVSVKPRVQVSVEPTVRSQVSVEPPVPVSVEPPVPVSVSKPKAKPHQKKPEAGPSNPSKGKKRKGESLDARPKKSRIVSQEFINTSDEETEKKSEPRPRLDKTVSNSKSKTDVFVEISVKPPSQLQPRADEIEPKPKSKPRPRARSRKVEPIMKSESGEEIAPKPKSKSQLVKKPMKEKTAKRLEAQNDAILKGEFRLADQPCDTCTRRTDRQFVPCAETADGEKGVCFTCRLGKTHCSFLDGEIKIVRKKAQKPKDVKMAEISDRGLAVDVEMTEVGQSKGPENQDVDMARSEQDTVVKMTKVVQSQGPEKKARDIVEIAEVGESKGPESQDVDMARSEPTQATIDFEMAEVTSRSEPQVGTIARPDKGKGRATPVIVVEPPTPVKGLPDLADVHPTTLNGFDLVLGSDADHLSLTSHVNSTPADNNDSRPASRSVSNSRRVSPPQAEEIHLDTAMNMKIDFRSISPPPPNFNMQTIQKELTRLARDQTEFHEKLREHKAEADALEELWTYTQNSIQRHEVDPSAVIDGSPTLTTRLAALEEITQRLQQDELNSRPLLEKIKDLETSVWFQQGQTNSADARMERLEEYNRELWRGAQDRINLQQRELGSIRVEHERFEAEMKETVRVLEKNSQITPAALEERLTESIGKLTSRVGECEQSVMAMLKSVTVLSEQNMQLIGRQSSLEQLIVQHFGRKKIKTDAEIDATKETWDIGTNTIDVTKATLDIGTNTDHSSISLTPSLAQPPKIKQKQASKSSGPLLLAPNPVLPGRAKSPSPFPGSRKSPRLQEKEAIPAASNTTNNDQAPSI